MLELQAGDWVEVRTNDEILRTLDKNGRLDGLPFMPQMFKYCGQRFRVYKKAHKTCDTISGRYLGRALPEGIHLDLRCDGRAYAGCEAACLIFWNQAWLKPVGGDLVATDEETSSVGGLDKLGLGCTVEDVWTGTRSFSQGAANGTTFVCQATEVLNFTRPLPWYDVRQYLEDYRSGNVSFGPMVRGLIYVGYYYGALTFRGRIGAPGRWMYDFFQGIWGGIPYPRRTGVIPAGKLTPERTLNLQPGELVRVKSYQEILSTLDTHCKNRGLSFDAELVPYCGRVFRVRSKVSTFVDERTGKLKTLKTPAVILEGAFCQARYSSCRMFCPRSILAWWREIWLDRVGASDQDRG